MIPGLLLCGLAVAWGHPPDELMKASFVLQNDALICEVEVHYSQLYSLKFKEGGTVTSNEYSAIVRSFHMNCPVLIDGKLIKPELVRFEDPNGQWGGDYLDHAHRMEEIRIGRMTLRYPLLTTPRTVAVTWKLIPEDELVIPFSAPDELVRFRVTPEEPEFIWINKRVPAEDFTAPLPMLLLLLGICGMLALILIVVRKKQESKKMKNG